MRRGQRARGQRGEERCGAGWRGAAKARAEAQVVALRVDGDNVFPDCSNTYDRDDRASRPVRAARTNSIDTRFCVIFQPLRHGLIISQAKESYECVAGAETQPQYPGLRCYLRSPLSPRPPASAVFMNRRRASPGPPHECHQHADGVVALPLIAALPL